MLDIYEIDKNNKELFITSIIDEEYQYLHNIFLEYQRKTGLLIDQYTDLKLSPIDSIILINLLKNGNHQVHTKYYLILNSIQNSNHSINFIGD